MHILLCCLHTFGKCQHHNGMTSHQPLCLKVKEEDVDLVQFVGPQRVVDNKMDNFSRMAQNCWTKRSACLLKQISSLEITSTAALLANVVVVVVDLSRVFHAIDSAALQSPHMCTPAPHGTLDVPAALPTHTFGDVDHLVIQIFALCVRCCSTVCKVATVPLLQTKIALSPKALPKLHGLRPPPTLPPHQGTLVTVVDSPLPSDGC